MLRRDYLGSILVCSILISLVGLGVYKASHVDLGLYFKIVGSILAIALFIGFITSLIGKE